MPIRCLLFDCATVAAPQERLRFGPEIAIGAVDLAASAWGTDEVAFDLDTAQLKVQPDDPSLIVVASAIARCYPREVAVVAAASSPLVQAALGAGAHVIDASTPLDAALDELGRQEAETRGAIGLGPHTRPWPEGPQYDQKLLADGDRRNVVDRYRYWSEAAIVANLESRRQPLHVAIENWQHDLNIGTVVRNANAFNVAGVHIIGQRRWNRRGAMATDRYLTVTHHATVDEFGEWAEQADLTIIGIDNVPGAQELTPERLPRNAVMVFGQEGPGLSDEMEARCKVVLEIEQFGSTRSINAGVASGIAIHAWSQAHNGTAWP